MNRKAEKKVDLARALSAAAQAATSVGVLMRRQLRSPKRAFFVSQHDIKLELDVRCQKMIERQLHAAFPDVGSLGEEGVAEDPNTEYRWVVDPIDGTVNFAYCIPHACVSIALQSRAQVQPERLAPTRRGSSVPAERRRNSKLGRPSGTYPDGFKRW